MTEVEEKEEDKGKEPVDNGNTFEKYRWEQVLGEVTLTLPYPENIRGKDVNIKITDDTFTCKIHGKDYVNGKWCKLVDPYDTLWHIEDGKDIIVEIIKKNDEEWWDCCFQDEEKINTSKIVPPTSKLSDLDGQTRSVVEKMMFDQRAKQMGMPTSEEREKHRMLEKVFQKNPEFAKQFKGQMGRGGGRGAPNINFN